MNRTRIQAVAGAALVAAVATGCGSDSSDGAGAGQQKAGDQAVQQVDSAIQQATQSSPVTFSLEKADLTDQSKQTLATIAKAMQGNPVRLKVETHGGYANADMSKTLSQQRAQAISTELEQAGVTKDRIETDPKGNEKAQGSQALATQFSATS
ncbi:OmpA family protein [Amycolatopsis jiangsuensis]|uniref:Outer membrane protein OmpA-like peptidoglycan-associated protein n=1 Tax=Amycolatopsis jiangsuensis TaxID=1181879 RepID=A0A840IRS4_9PSEU|nr:OmpA family protein [Amycolatopsis jiangsuensis]MBB4684135.1 outer membrane protein OmpA-like peptidoglycan-associated protein [Amycolatopsis jiangsuensis]